MGAMKNNRLNGKTIVEAVVAMVIIVTVFTIAATLFAQTGRKFTVNKKAKAAGVLMAYSLQTKRLREAFAGTEILNGFVVKREVEDSLSSYVARFHFSVYDADGALLDEWRENLQVIR